MRNLILILFVLCFDIICQVTSQSVCSSSSSPFNVANSCCSGALSMPKSVTSIVDYAYLRCYAITSLTVASTVTSIGTKVIINIVI